MINTTPTTEAELLELADSLVKKSNRSAWNRYVTQGLWREIVPWTFAGIAIVVALVAVNLTTRYAGSITTVDRINTVDRFGQVIGVNGVLVRQLPDQATHEAIDSFVTCGFTVVSSKIAMQANASLCQQLAGTDEIRAVLRDWWRQHSPLAADGSWTDPVAEVQVTLTSVLRRNADHDRTDYTVEWSTKQVYANGATTPPVLFMGDVVVASGYAPLTGDLGGYRVVAFSYSQVK